MHTARKILSNGAFHLGSSGLGADSMLWPKTLSLSGQGMSCRKLGKELEIWLGQGQCGAWSGGGEEGRLEEERCAITSLHRESLGSTQHITIHSCFQARYYYRLCNTGKKALIH